MKYDYSRCNNLDWKTKSSSGFMKVNGEEITLFCYKNSFDTLNGNSCYSYFSTFHSGETLEASFPDLEIIPRDPKTYNMFKEGDSVSYVADSGVVLFSTPKVAIVSWDNSEVQISENGYDSDLELKLTDYEKQLMLKTRKDVIHFNPGDRVIGRDEDSDDSTWDFGIFEEMSEDDGKPIYLCKFKEFTECLPFNEETCKLLGTTDDYGN